MIHLILSSVLLMLGLFMLLLSVFGLFRFSTTLNRVHALRCDILGALFVILGVIIMSGYSDRGSVFSSMKMLAVMAVIALTYPVITREAASSEARINNNLSKVCDILKFSSDNDKLVSMDGERWGDWSASLNSQQMKEEI